MKLDNLFDFIDKDCFIGHAHLSLHYRHNTIPQTLKIIMLKQYNKIKNAGHVRIETGGVSLFRRSGMSLTEISTLTLYLSNKYSKDILYKPWF